MDNYNLQQTDAKIQAILNKVQPVVDDNTVAGFGNGYVICTTVGATADKEVTINGFTPTIGGVFSVMFQNAFSASDPTLNVSNTGAKDLMLFGSALPAAFVPAGTILTLTYDGTNYNVIGRLNDITVKSTLESTDSPLLQDANGNFIKSTPAALASLLGGIRPLILSTADDLNSITKTSIHSTSGTTANRPTSAFVGGLAITIIGSPTNNSYNFQIWVDLSNYEVYWRTSFANTSFSTWKKITSTAV